MGCDHKHIREVLESGAEWDGEQCGMAHFSASGEHRPSCWLCPDCGEYIGWQEREMVERFLANGGPCMVPEEIA